VTLFHGTTILAVRRDGRVALGGDGQVSIGDTVMKAKSIKVRALKGGKVLAGFAGSVADALTLYEKFAEGGWMTVIITSATIAVCFRVRQHYREVSAGFKDLDKILEATPLPEKPIADAVPMDKNAPTAILTVQSFSGFGLHQILSIQRLMPGYIKNFIFISVGVVDSGNFKGSEELARLEEKTRSNLEKYVQWCRQQGLKADYRMAIATESVETLEKLCVQLAKEFPRSIVFTGKLIFREEHWYQRFLHNETATALQSRLQFDGLQTIVLPIRVLPAANAGMC